VWGEPSALLSPYPPPSRFPYPHSAIPQPKPTVLQWGEEEGDSTAGCRLPQVLMQGFQKFNNLT